MIDLTGKTALVMGVANAKSIALQIGRTLKKAGGRVLYTYEGDRTKIAVRQIVDSDDLIFPCNVLEDNEIQALVQSLKDHKITLDVVVHAIAYAAPSSLTQVEKVSRPDFNLAMDISAHSLIAGVAALEPLLNRRCSIMTLSYIGGTRAVPSYGMMGIEKAALESSVRYLAVSYGRGGKEIRVNAISCGPLPTTSSRAIPDFSRFEEFHAKGSAFGRNISYEEVANTALFLASTLSQGITGQILFVDAGFSMMIPPLDDHD